MWTMLIILGIIIAIILTYSIILDFLNKQKKCFSLTTLKILYVVGLCILVALAIDITIALSNYSAYVPGIFD